MVTSDLSPEVEIRPFRACAMHPAIITGTVRSLLTWLWGRYHVPQNAFLVRSQLKFPDLIAYRFSERERYMSSPVRLSVVCNVRATYSAIEIFGNLFTSFWYLGHPLTSR